MATKATDLRRRGYCDQGGVRTTVSTGEMTTGRTVCPDCRKALAINANRRTNMATLPAHKLPK